MYRYYIYFGFIVLQIFTRTIDKFVFIIKFDEASVNSIQDYS